MTNPNPLIITNKFPSWIIQDKNQPPSWPSRPASDRLGLIYFCFLAETSIPPFYPNTRNSPQSLAARQMVRRGQPSSSQRKGESSWCAQCQSVICHVSSDLCHLRGNHRVILTSAWHHRDTDPHTVSPANPDQAGAGGEIIKIFWVWWGTYFYSALSICWVAAWLAQLAAWRQSRPIIGELPSNILKCMISLTRRM